MIKAAGGCRARVALSTGAPGASHTPSGSQKAMQQQKAKHLEVDDLPSTAAPSVVQSPAGGPEVAPRAAKPLELADLPAATGAAAAGGGALDVDRVLSALGAHSQALDSNEAGLQDKARGLRLRLGVEGYLSSSNLCHDYYLRSRMDEQGWVPLDEIAKFAALRSLGAPAVEVAAALDASVVVDVSEDRTKVRPACAALRAAFAPRHVADVTGPISPASMSPGAAHSPAVDVADEDLTIAASLISDGGKSTPFARSSRQSRRRGHAATKRTAARGAKGSAMPGSRYYGEDGTGLCVLFDSEIAQAPEVDDIGAWMHFSDDTYPSSGASMLWW